MQHENGIIQATTMDQERLRQPEDAETSQNGGQDLNMEETSTSLKAMEPLDSNEDRLDPNTVASKSREPDMQASTSSQFQDPVASGSTESQDHLVTDLGVQIYDRDQFEAQVMTQVDQMMEEREKEAKLERDKKEMKEIAKKLAEVGAKMNKAEATLERLHREEGGGRRRSITLLDEVEKLRQQKEELEDKREEVISELKEMGEWDKVRKELGIRDMKRKAEKEGERESAKAVLKKEEKKESEKEKRIRLGEMTAFGKSLKSKRDEHADKEFKRYFKEQMKLNTITEEDQDGWKKAKKRKRRKSREMSDNEEEEDFAGTISGESSLRTRVRGFESFGDFRERKKRFESLAKCTETLSR
jgi:hypothetical protein